MLGRAQNGETLTVTKIVIGSGSAAQPSDLWPLISLIAHQMDVTFSTKRDYGQGTLLVEGSFRSDTAPAAFYLREVGVMAHIGAEADQLYSVANVLADPADYIDPAAPTMQSFKVKLIIDRIPTASLVVQIGPSENVIGSNIGADTVGPGWYKDAAGNVLSFKRIVEGTGMDIHEATDGNSVYVGISTLKNNLDLYVPTSYPGIGDPNLLFPSIQAAHDYLLQFVIPTNRFATIHVDAGLIHSSGIFISHPNASQISIIGRPRIDTAVTAVNYVNATTKNVFCNTTGLAVGQIVYLTGFSPSFSAWSGGCIISAIGAGYVTVNTYNRGSQAAFTLNDPNAGRRLSRYPTVLVNDAGTGTQHIDCPNGIKLLQYLTVRYGNAGIQPGLVSVISDCLVLGQNWGIQSKGVLCQLQGEVVICDCGSGLSGIGQISSGGVLIVNGCTGGISPAGRGDGIGAITSGEPSVHVYVNHCGTAMSVYGGAYCRCGQLHLDRNDIGISSNMGSIFNVAGPYINYLSGNGLDLYALNASFLYYDRNGGTVPTTNPAAGVVGNSNSWIAVAA